MTESYSTFQIITLITPSVDMCFPSFSIIPSQIHCVHSVEQLIFLSGLTVMEEVFRS